VQVALPDTGAPARLRRVDTAGRHLPNPRVTIAMKRSSPVISSDSVKIPSPATDGVAVVLPPRCTISEIAAPTAS
jgi:hypothetical protein